jgi:Uma2 family endonuclease
MGYSVPHPCACTTLRRDRTASWSSSNRLAPDLVAEVGSPGESRRHMAARARRWLDRGVRLVWVVWPRRRKQSGQYKGEQ